MYLELENDVCAGSQSYRSVPLQRRVVQVVICTGLFRVVKAERSKTLNTPVQMKDYLTDLSAFKFLSSGCFKVNYLPVK